MADSEEIECRISWSDILSNSNPEQLIFRLLQLQNINAYTDKGQFTTAKGKLHCIDDITTRERVYIWCDDTRKYPKCNCLTCKDNGLFENEFSRDFQYMLILQLYQAGGAKDTDIAREYYRVRTAIDLAERLRRDREETDRRRREQEQQEQARRAAQEENRRVQRLERERQREITRTQKIKEKEPQVIPVTVQEVVQVRQVRLDD